MNLNKDPSSYARINPVVVATWAPSEVQQFVGLALDDIGKLAAELDRRIQWQSFATAPKDGRWIIARCNDHSAMFLISWGRDRKGEMRWCSPDASYGDGLFLPLGDWIEAPQTRAPGEHTP